MKIAVLSPVAWRTPPRKYGPWEQVASNITEGLVEKGHDVTLFATGESETKAKLNAIIPVGYEEDEDTDPKVAECAHIGHLMSMAGEFDIIHNNFDFLPLTYTPLIKTPMVTTIHGFSSPMIIPVYEQYQKFTNYVSISNSDRSDKLTYAATVYNGIEAKDFTPIKKPGDYLLYFGRIHHDKGTFEAIQIARKAGIRLVISGLIQDEKYWRQKVKPFIDGKEIEYVGNSGPEKRNELLGGALGLLHPINFREPFGLSVVEGMMCGTPVVAFNKGSMPELIRDGKDGFLVQNVNGAVDVLHKLESLDRLAISESARQRFSVDRMVGDYLKVYKRILNK